MSAVRVPLVVVSGYLGAGKTTLINRLLTEDHGLRLLVLVNDFGAINIDAGLIAEAGGDTIALTNGCVCCTMGADLFLALGDALDRRPRPDALVVEASGIADPARIAEAAKAEPDLSYSGVVTVVDGNVYTELAADAMIGPQVRQQVARADLVVLRGHQMLETKVDAPVITAESDAPLAPLLFGLQPTDVVMSAEGGHPPYVGWHTSTGEIAHRAALEAALAGRPPGLFRLKGTVGLCDGSACDVQVVGRSVVIKRATGDGSTRLVGLGLSARVTEMEIGAWWSECVTPRREEAPG
jgi:Ni2+-binding GTPase involved in maturation of urease and hydrogenase